MKPGADGVTASCASKTPIITTRCRRHDGRLHLAFPQWTDTAAKTKRGLLKMKGENPLPITVKLFDPETLTNDANRQMDDRRKT